MSQKNLILELVGIFQIIYLFCVTSWAYGILPDIIPTHYGMGGRPDAFGDKYMIFFFPIIVASIYAFISLLVYYGDALNNGLDIDHGSLKEFGPTLKVILLNNMCIIGIILAFKALTNKYELIGIICGYFSIWIIIPGIVLSVTTLFPSLKSFYKML